MPICPCQFLYHSFTHSIYALTDLYREFRSIHLRDTLVEVSDYYRFLTLQTKVMDLYTRLYEDKSLRLQRVKKAYTQRADFGKGRFGQSTVNRGKWLGRSVNIKESNKKVTICVGSSLSLRIFCVMLIAYA